MGQYIDKDALAAEIERRRESNAKERYFGRLVEDNYFLDFLATLEVKEIGVAFSNIDDELEELGIDPFSKEAKIFKESYYMALEKFKSQKGEKI